MEIFRLGILLKGHKRSARHVTAQSQSSLKLAIIFLQHFGVTSVEYSSTSSVANLLYVIFLITLFDHSYSLYPKMGKCTGKFKTAFEFYTP